MPSASAASGMVRPAKNRSFTNWAQCGIKDGETLERLVEGEQVVGRRRRRQTGFLQVDSPQVAAVADALPTAGILNKDATHGLGRGGEEVASAVPWLLIAD